MANSLTLAVAGSGKTHQIVEHCSGLPKDSRTLVVTYTQANQVELAKRLSYQAGDHHHCVVMGWFMFLLRDFARPFLPFKFPRKRVCGFNFDGRPNRYATGISRFLDSNGSVYACELGRLSCDLIAESKGTLKRRLECVYDRIFIDEVQDLGAHDFEIMDFLFSTCIDVSLVGDIRQAVLSTNPRSSKNRSYGYAESINWFRQREEKGILTVTESKATWRCRPEIASFADSLFDEASGFPQTESKNLKVSGHDGVFMLLREHTEEYVQRFNPVCMRDSANSAKDYDLRFMNFKISKGTESDRVLILPTKPILDFLQKGTPLKPKSASSLYVAVTRAKQSVAFVVEAPFESTIPFWTP